MLTAQQASLPDSEADSCVSSAPPCVLVVEDSHDTLRLAKRIFEKGGMRCHGVECGEHALEWLASNCPDLICSDLDMPGIGGIELCRAVRSSAATKEVPFIILTALSGVDPIGEAFAAGANDYVSKPLRPVELVSRARRHIAEGRQRRQAFQRIQTLDCLNETKNRFLGVASHDLRNPLVSIRGISQYLQSERFGPLNDSQQEMIAAVAEASGYMLTLVEDLLDISKIEADHMDLKLEPRGVGDLIRQAALLHQAAADRKRISITADDQSGDALASLDRKLITRVIDNLVSNAIKFSAPDTRVTIAGRATDSAVSVSVDDEGPGIPPQEFDRLFKEFSRTSNLPTGGESSSGIGLYVVKRIAQRHSAEIAAENRPQGGARFTLTLPRIRP